MRRSSPQFKRFGWPRLILIAVVLGYGILRVLNAERDEQAAGPPVSQPLPQWVEQTETPPDAAAPAEATELAAGTHVVRRVVDGDTLLLETGQRIRLIGVDTPETVAEDRPVQPWGPEASEFTKQFIAAGDNRVRLQFDAERQDQYGRYLAYVWVGNRMLNEELLRQGLGRPLLRFPYAEEMKRRFRQATDEARAAGRGIHSAD